MVHSESVAIYEHSVDSTRLAAVNKRLQYVSRGGSRILQGHVSNPSERGTGGRAAKAPRRVGSGEGAVPPPQKMLVFLISKW